MGLKELAERIRNERKKQAAPLDARARELLLPYMEAVQQLGCLEILKEAPLIEDPALTRDEIKQKTILWANVRARNTKAETEMNFFGEQLTGSFSDCREDFDLGNISPEDLHAIYLVFELESRRHIYDSRSIFVKQIQILIAKKFTILTRDALIYGESEKLKEAHFGGLLDLDLQVTAYSSREDYWDSKRNTKPIARFRGPPFPVKDCNREQVEEEVAKAYMSLTR